MARAKLFLAAQQSRKLFFTCSHMFLIPSIREICMLHVCVKSTSARDEKVKEND